MLIEPHFGIKGVGSADPVDCGLDFSSVGGFSASGGRVISAVKFEDIAGGVFDDVFTFDEITVAQTDFPAGRQAVKLFGRVFHKVVPLDVQYFGEGNLACSGGWIFRIVNRFEHFSLSVRIIGQDDFERIEDGHDTRRGFVEVFAQAVFEEGIIDGAVEFVDADDLAEIADGLWGIAASPQPAQGRHSRVIPAADAVFLDQPQQFSFAHQGIGEIETGKLNLTGMMDAQLVQKPVVKRPVIFKLESTN